MRRGSRRSHITTVQDTHGARIDLGSAQFRQHRVMAMSTRPYEGHRSHRDRYFLSVCEDCAEHDTHPYYHSAHPAVSTDTYWMFFFLLDMDIHYTPALASIGVPDVSIRSFTLHITSPGNSGRMARTRKGREVGCSGVFMTRPWTWKGVFGAVQAPRLGRLQWWRGRREER